MKLYYLICVDAIYKASNKNPDGWKAPVILYLSAFLGLIFMAVSIIIEKNIPNFKYSFFSSNDIDSSAIRKIDVILLYFVPALIINYFIILYNSRYEVLIKKYKHGHGMYVINFIVFSIFSMFLAMLYRMW